MKFSTVCAYAESYHVKFNSDAYNIYDVEYRSVYRLQTWQPKSCDSIPGRNRLTSHILVVQKLRMSGAIRPLSRILSWRAQGQLGLYILSIFDMKLKFVFVVFQDGIARNSHMA
jgi:hypothetical protein